MAEQKDKSAKRKPRPLWQKGLVGVSLLLMLLGGGLSVYAWMTQPGPSTGDGATSSAYAPRGLFETPRLPSGEDEDAAGDVQTDPRAVDVWSPAIFKLGFSFFAGFCVAYTLRTFLKVSLFFVGIVLLAFFGLQYAGMVSVDWAGIEQRFNSAAAWAGDQFESFRHFVTGYLPSSVSAAAGLFVGFRKG